MEIRETEFPDYWNQVKDAILRIVRFFTPNGSPIRETWEKEIDELRTCSLEGGGSSFLKHATQVFSVRCVIKLATVGAWLGGTIYVINWLKNNADVLANLVECTLPDGISVMGIEFGSIKLQLCARDVLAMKELRKRYDSGQLKEDLEKFLVTEELKQLANEPVEFIVEMDEDEYRLSLQYLYDNQEATEDLPCKSEREKESDSLKEDTAQDTVSQEEEDEVMASSSWYKETDEKINYTKLSRLLVNGGTQAVRSVFDGIHPPSSLKAILKSNKTTLQKLKKPKGKVLSNEQWDKLYPPSGSGPTSEDFDITLLFVLLRNICGLTPPATGWDVLPPGTDTSLEADLARVRYYRNNTIAQKPNIEINDVDFAQYWQDISSALLSLGLSQDDIDDFKSAPLGEKDYKQLLYDWYISDKDVKIHLEEVRSKTEDSESHLAVADEGARHGKHVIPSSHYDISNMDEKKMSLLLQPQAVGSKREDKKDIHSGGRNIVATIHTYNCRF